MKAVTQQKACPIQMRAVRDSLDILGGKWKISIIGALAFGGKHRFMELEREVTGITPKMLSKELQDLEINKLVTRTVLDTKPVTVEYQLTDYGATLENVLKTLADWGTQHRTRMMKK
jgi:DNA-binding HxlR family transcriptional regulator